MLCYHAKDTAGVFASEYRDHQVNARVGSMHASTKTHFSPQDHNSTKCYPFLMRLKMHEQHRSLYQASHTTLTCVQVRLARIGHIAINKAATLLLTRNAMCSCGMGTCMYKILMLYLLDDSCSRSVFFFFFFFFFFLDY
jgi:hypothetical protein